MRVKKRGGTRAPRQEKQTNGCGDVVGDVQRGQKTGRSKNKSRSDEALLKWSFASERGRSMAASVPYFLHFFKKKKGTSVVRGLDVGVMYRGYRQGLVYFPTAEFRRS